MIRVEEELRKRGFQSRMILQVHDELIFESPVDEADAVGALACELMPGTLEMRVPLKVDVKRGKDWGRMETAPVVTSAS
jgi:DNA polymerase-1